MRLKAVVVLLVVGMSAPAQTLDAPIPVPDAFGGLIRPQCLAENTASGTIYVSGTNICGAAVVAINPSTGERIARVPVNRDIHALAYNPTNSLLYCADRDDHAVTIIDTRTNQIIEAVAAEQPAAFAVNATDNKVYCANPEAGTVTVIDGTTNTVIGTVPVGGTPVALCHDPTTNRIFCANQASGTVSVIACRQDTVIGTLAVGQNPFALAYNVMRDKVYCLNGDATVSIIDGQGLRVLATVQVGSAPRAIC
ncbi:MAG: YncE family protein, partial [candidate division WOR-3 bacterium]